MGHFLEHYWVTAIAVIVVMVFLVILEILLWRLRKLKKQYDYVHPLTNLPPAALEFLALIRQVLSASKAEINQVNEELQKLKRGLEANKDKSAGKEKGLSER
jgi:ABC-type proline/glycine betaine transport system permease subunit